MEAHFLALPSSILEFSGIFKKKPSPLGERVGTAFLLRVRSMSAHSLDPEQRAVIDRTYSIR
jgi:hypothetical protein